MPWADKVAASAVRRLSAAELKVTVAIRGIAAMRALFAVVILLQSGWTVEASADQQMSGRGLFVMCMAERVAYERGESPFDEAFCHGFIQGVFDVFSAEHAERICVPSDIRRHDIRDAWMQAVRENDELIALPAYASVLATLSHLYPCR